MYRKLISIILILLFTFSCVDTLTSVKRGLTGEKQKSGDEFLVKKKDPLILPPDFENLPLPDEEMVIEDDEISLEKTLRENTVIEDDSKESSVEDSILRQINKN